MSTSAILGAVSLTAATAANVFTSPRASGEGAMFNVRISNNAASAADVQISFSLVSATLDAARSLIPTTNVPTGEYIELTGLACSTEYLVAESSVTGVSVIAIGVETP